jgi:hypothetical protein
VLYKMEHVIGMTICNSTLGLNRGLYCKRCNISLKPEMIVFYTGNSSEAYVCDPCRNLRALKHCSKCHRSLNLDVPIHIIDETPICQECYKGTEIKEPDLNE